MAPIKFEENIREKLEGREIEPSSDAWRKLSERLDENSNKKNNYLIWYAIAASFIGVLIAVSVFSSRGDKLNENSTDFVDVNTSESEVPLENLPNLVDNTSEENDKMTLILQESNSITLNKETISGKEELLPKKKAKALKNTESVVTEAIAKTSQKNQVEKMSHLPEEIIASDELIMEKRTNELIAQVELGQQNKEFVSEEEINTLLANAESKIESKRIVDSNKIDPAALLGDVELEMENSFREKVFTALGDGYNIIKTAVVNRNN